MDLYYDEFGYKLKYIRELRGLTQKELAAKTGISNQAISNLERGYTKTLNYRDLKILAQHLDCGVGDFFEGLDKRTLVQPVDIKTKLLEIIEMLSTRDIVINGVRQDDEMLSILSEMLKSIINIIEIKTSYISNKIKK